MQFFPSSHAALYLKPRMSSIADYSPTPTPLYTSQTSDHSSITRPAPQIPVRPSSATLSTLPHLSLFPSFLQYHPCPAYLYENVVAAIQQIPGWRLDASYEGSTCVLRVGIS